MYFATSGCGRMRKRSSRIAATTTSATSSGSIMSPLASTLAPVESSTVAIIIGVRTA
jgi:hypothetical protein